MLIILIIIMLLIIIMILIIIMNPKSWRWSPFWWRSCSSRISSNSRKSLQLNTKYVVHPKLKAIHNLRNSLTRHNLDEAQCNMSLSLFSHVGAWSCYHQLLKASWTSVIQWLGEFRCHFKWYEWQAMFLSRLLQSIISKTRQLLLRKYTRSSPTHIYMAILPCKGWWLSEQFDGY